MKVYQIGPDGLYEGSFDADPNPRRPGQFIIPAGCVTISPPSAPGKRARYIDGGWRLEDIPAPPSAPEIAPPPVKTGWDTVREKADFLLALADRHIAEAVAAGASIPAAWTSFRTALSAIAEAETGDADAVIWPEAPRQIEKPETSNTLENYAADKRYRVEIGGISLNGMHIATDRQSQSMIGNAVQIAGLTGRPIQFKAGNGFVELTPEQMTGVALAVAAHVQACFSAEKKALEKIGAGEITTREQIDAAFSEISPLQ